MKLSRIVFLVYVITAAGCLSANGELDNIFADMEKALRTRDEALMKTHWTERGYRESVVGNSGLSGGEMFEEGSAEEWYPKPDLSKNTVLGKAIIVESKLWSVGKNRSVDEVYFLLVKKGNSWKIEGAGEDLEEVRRLGSKISQNGRN